MLKRQFLLASLLLLSPLTANADGYKLRLESNGILAKNTEGIVPDMLFGHPFDVTNAVDGTYESSHGSVDANDAGSGFAFPVGGPNDSFTYHIQGLWTYAGGVASPAGAGDVLTIMKASDRSVLAQVNGSNASPTNFGVTATSTHELLWSVAQSSPVEMWGLVYSISGNAVASGLPFQSSPRLVAVQWTPQFQGDADAAIQAIYAAAVPEPCTSCLSILGLACLVRSGFGRRR